MYVQETVHRYPRLQSVVIELICGALVAVAAGSLGISVLRGVLDLVGYNRAAAYALPVFGPIIDWLDGSSARTPLVGFPLLWGLVPGLSWLALALLIALVLRNLLPTVRTSSRGMLVEFANGWLALSWEQLVALKVTEDLAAERFVLLAQAERKGLTSWHRLYSLIYRLSWRRGFLISSRISDFNTLVQTILSETERAARSGEKSKALRLEEDAQSPLFKLLLSPASFFSRRATDEPAPAAVAVAGVQAAGGPVRASYPRRISAIFSGGATLIAVLAGLQYLNYWVRFLALELPFVRGLPPFSWALSSPAYIELINGFRTQPVPFLGFPGRPDLPAPWWLLVAAHLMLALAYLALVVIRNLLPSLEARSEGLAVRDMFSGRWKIWPWQTISAVKATDISEQSQVILVQSSKAGSSPAGLISSLLYDGSPGSGVLITSAISNFQGLLSYAIERLSPLEQQTGRPILRQEAHSWLFWLALGPKAASAAMVEEARADQATRQPALNRLAPLGLPMLALAALPALMIFFNQLLHRDAPPSLGVLGGALLMLALGLFEWPLVGVLSVVLDENTGGGEEDYRALYLYPLAQLPRLLPMLGALVFQSIGVPLLPMLLWLSAIVWAFFLTRSLFEALYGWADSQALLGGLMPVAYQLIMLLFFLLAVR
jgi:hypothetical protein